MSTLVGVLLDVSRSMELNIDGEADTDNGWIRSTFDALDRLIEHDDFSGHNKVFAICVGGNKEENRSLDTFDLLNTLKVFSSVQQLLKGTAEERRNYEVLSTENIIERALEIVKSSGAPFVNDWTSTAQIQQNISRDDAITILRWLEIDQILAKLLAKEYLPSPCRTPVKAGIDVAAILPAVAIAAVFPVFALITIPAAIGACAANHSKKATAADIQKVIGKIKSYIHDHVKSHIKPQNVCSSSVLNVKDASTLLRGAIGNKKHLTKEQIDEIMKAVEPFIYGRTPLISALNQAKDLFAESKYKEYKKLLFVLSDGDPTDGGRPPIEELTQLDVTTVCCYITQKKINQPRRLYSVVVPDWEEEAKFMFYLSSSLKTQLLPRTVFVKKGWKIDIENNQTKLFAQVNHPDLINEVSDLAKNVVFCQDAIIDILASVSLDIYVNQNIHSFGAPSQVGGTCYANASAAVLHLAMYRIHGRDGGYPEFRDLREGMIQKYGVHGANTKKVLQEVCPKYRLHVKRVQIKEAMLAITAKRPVLATFHLSGSKWDAFSSFYAANASGILTKGEINKTYPKKSGPGGHAVVLVGYNSESLRFMNSWGFKFANKGFFSIKNADVLGCQFYDVYWTVNDLYQSEKQAFDRFGSEVAQQLTNRLQSLQTTEYQCPFRDCQVKSKVMEFTGTMEKVNCPRCGNEFSLKKGGLNIALAIYLTSLQAPITNI